MVSFRLFVSSVYFVSVCSTIPQFRSTISRLFHEILLFFIFLCVPRFRSSSHDDVVRSHIFFFCSMILNFFFFSCFLHMLHCLYSRIHKTVFLLFSFFFLPVLASLARFELACTSRNLQPPRPARHFFLRRAGDNHRPRGAHGRGQDYDKPPALPLLRPRQGNGKKRRRGRGGGK